MPTSLQLIPGTLATNCWASDPQTTYNEMFEKGSALIGDLTGIIISSSQPDPEDRDKAWLKLSSQNGPPAFYLVYIWYNGYWVARHPSPAGGDERRVWVGDLTDLQTYDGGDTGSASAASGPMWEEDTAFAGRFPVGVGTVPDASTAVTVATDVGAGQVTLAEANMPPHSHEIGGEDSVSSGDSEAGRFRVEDGTLEWTNGNSTEIGYTRSKGGSGDPAVAQPFNIVPPARGIYVIRRTSRIYYRGT